MFDLMQYALIFYDFQLILARMSVAPELLYMEAKWSSLVSYGRSLDALQDFLPLDRILDVKTVCYDTLKVAKRMEAELGEERSGFIEGDPRDWERLSTPEGVFTVGIDGGYVRHWLDKKHHFEVIVGKSILSFQEDEEDRTPSLKRFGFVQTYDDAKPKRRLHEVLHSQGLQMNQEMTFLSDGDDTLRALQMEMSPKATHILDWFHLTMKLTVLGQFGKGLVQCEAVLGEAIATIACAGSLIALLHAMAGETRTVPRRDGQMAPPQYSGATAPPSCAWHVHPVPWGWASGSASGKRAGVAKTARGSTTVTR